MSVGASLQDVFADPREKNEVKQTIALTDNIENMVPKGFDAQLVIKRIEAFNSQGAGRIKQLIKNRELFSLRVGSLRILLRVSSEDKGRRIFTIVDIGDRRDIYKKIT